MAQYKKLSDYTVEATPNNGDLVPLIVDNGDGTYDNALMTYESIKGAPGTNGTNGQGVIPGGTTNQVLAKTSGTDYATQWKTIDKTAVGLPNVDNTSDADKPMSTATQTAINTVQNNLDTSIVNGLDGFHASATPTANKIPVLDGNAKLPITAVPGYAFKARRNTNLSSASGCVIVIVFNREYYDYGSWYDNTTGLATAPVNGIYHFEASAFTETVVTGRTFYVSRGSGSVGERAADFDSSQVRRAKGTWEVYLTAGQTFGVNLYTSAVNQLNSADTWFSGYLVMAV